VADDSATDYRMIYTDVSGWLAGEWHHITVSWDSALTLKMYLDGGEITPSSYDEGTPGLPTALGATFDMGGYSGAGGELDGTLDEVRISTVARDACQIETEHKNQDSPSTFYTVGGEQDLTKFTYRKEITIDKDQVGTSCGSDLTDFPFMINIQNDSDLKTTANGGYVQDSNGYDIIFRASDGSSQLDHEIEQYDGNTGTLVAWVRIPVLSVTTDTTIYMYYGNSTITSPTENPTGVWDSKYAAVWHLNETPTVDAYAYDSTSNNNDGTSQGSMTSDDQVTGKIDGSLDFDGGDDYIDLPDDKGLQTVTNAITISGWIKIGNMTQDQYYYSAGLWSANNQGVFVATYNGGYIGFGTGDGTTFADLVSSGTCSTDWQHVVATWNGTTKKIYINGSEDPTTAGFTGPIDYTGSDTFIGMGWTPSGGNFEGTIDELRISNVARDACWIETEFSNQDAPATFYSVGSQENLQAYSYRKEITIDFNRVGSSCGSDLYDFPVLVSITGDNDLKTAPTGHVESADGYDIIFKDSDGNQLDHEVEKYDGSAGTLVAWVRMPTLSSSTNTIIHMYYGNSYVTSSTENPSGVWDENYVGVWHLDEEQAGTGTADVYQDSTANANHGDDYLSATGQEGQIDGGQEFDGTDDYVDLDSHIGDYASLSEGSISIWFKYTDTSGYRLMFSASCNTDASSDLDIMYHQPDDVFMFGIREDGVDVLNCSFPANYADGSWHHYVMTVDSSGNNHYVDGSKITCNYIYGGDAATQAFFDSVTGLNTLRMGNREDSGGNEYHFGGNLDEVRISTVARSQCWIETEHNNQNWPNKAQDGANGFLSAGTEQNLEDFTYRRKITINKDQVGSSCGSDLSNFPTLIKIENDDELKTTANGGHVESSSGYDIIFRAADDTTQLDHEIEYYGSDQVTLRDGWYTGTGAYTVPNGTNRLLVFATSLESGADQATITDVTFGGTSMTRAVERFYYNGSTLHLRTEIWYMKDADIPASGSFNVSYSAGVTKTAHAYALFTNVDQTDPIVGSDSGTVASSTTVTTDNPFNVVAGGMSVSSAVSAADDGTYNNDGWGSGWTEWTEQNFPQTGFQGLMGTANTTSVYGSDGTDSGTATGTMTSAHVIVAASLRPTSGATLIAWVRIPLLSYTSDTTIYMYYGNSTITSPTEHPAAVWDNNYVGVWHMNIQDNGPSNDSTVYANDLTNSNTIAATTTGAIDGAADIEETDDESFYITDANQTSLDVTGNITISALIKLETIPSVMLDELEIVGKSGTGDRAYELFIDDSDVDKVELRLSGDGSGSTVTTANTALEANRWYHVAAVYNGTDVRIYLDGSLDCTPQAYSSGIYNSSREFHIGRRSESRPSSITWTSLPPFTL